MKNNCLATLVAFLLTFFLSVFILTAQVRTLSNPAFLVKLIKDSKILTKLPAVADAYIAASRGAGQENLNATVLVKIIAQSLDPVLLEKDVTNLMQASANFSQGRAKSLDATIDLKTFKDSFSQKWTNLAPGLYRTEYAKMRACKDGESSTQTTEQGIVINCQSGSVTAATLEASARAANLTEFLKLVPDQLSLNELTKNQVPKLDQARLGLNVLNLVFWISLILSLAGIASLVALGWPNARAICGWNGWIFIITAGPVLILDLLTKQINHLIQANLASKATADIIAIITPILNSMNQTIMRATIVVPAVITGLGLILVILSFSLPKYEPKIVPPGMTPPAK